MDSQPSRFAWTVYAVFFLAAEVSSFGEGRTTREITYPDGSLKERYTYTLDEKGQEVRQGVNEEFYPDGTKKGIRNWRDGISEGSIVYFHPNGRKSYEANYADGKKSGFATVWFPNGQKQWQTTFRSGKTHGRWREWYPDGKKKFEATYSDGALDGLATWWHDNGRIWQERTYHAGIPVRGSVKEWDRNGRQTFPPPDRPLEGKEPRQESSGAAAPSPTASKIEGSR